MSNSLRQHGIPEIKKQLRFQMKKCGLDTIVILLTRRAGKIRINFTGSPEHLVKANEILAAWA